MISLFDYLEQINLPRKTIKPVGEISRLFLAENIVTFWEAVKYVQKLPYGRTTDRANYFQVLIEKRGACSTKHALIAALAEELGVPVKLMLGIFLLTPNNTPKIASILESYNLKAVPEAHCYLKYNNKVLDITFPDSEEFSLHFVLEQEFTITTEQIGSFKLEKHRNFIKNRIKNNRDLNFELIWNVREQCIHKLSRV